MQQNKTIPPEAPRRTGAHAARVGGRSERVVREVLAAASAELARSGYSAFRIEEVAARAGVNKTTVYRRWPTKAELVAATLSAWSNEEPEPPATGALRSDLLQLLKRAVARSSTLEGQGIHRMILAELHHPEVEAIVHTLRIENRRPFLAAIDAAVARGELPEGVDGALMVEMIHAPVFNRVFKHHGHVSPAFMKSVIEIVVLGAQHGGATKG
jgi:AcrR family transcriptional regulator